VYWHVSYFLRKLEAEMSPPLNILLLKIFVLHKPAIKYLTLLLTTETDTRVTVPNGVAKQSVLDPLGISFDTSLDVTMDIEANY